MTTRTIHDPFLNKDVEISNNLLDRLRGKYACGPMLENGEPEFGWRQMPQIPIQLEAANEIERLQALINDLEDHIKDLAADIEIYERSGGYGV